MSDYLRTLVRHASNLHGQEFKLLAVMESLSTVHPPEYAGGRQLLAELMGWKPDADGAYRTLSKHWANLVRRGYLVHLDRGGPHGYARYGLVFPDSDVKDAALIRERYARAEVLRSAARRLESGSSITLDAPFPHTPTT